MRIHGASPLAARVDGAARGVLVDSAGNRGAGVGAGRGAGGGAESTAAPVKAGGVNVCLQFGHGVGWPADVSGTVTAC